MVQAASNMLQLFKPGDVIYGYCGGAFGRDSYDTKTCTFVTKSYAVFENEEGVGQILNFDVKDPETFENIATWKEDISKSFYSRIKNES